MRNIYFLPLLILLFACGTKEGVNTVLDVVSVDMEQEAVVGMSEIIEKIELIPFETNSDILLGVYDKLVYYKELDMYLVQDNKSIVWLFTGDGKFVSNSKSKQGEGADKYLICSDVLYNPHSKSIEILSPYGVIYRYDTLFQFKEKISLNRKDIVFLRFMCLDSNKYIMTPVMLSNKDVAILFCDYSQKYVSDPVSFEEGYIAPIFMNYDFCFYVKDNLILSPLGLDYNFYNIDIKSESISPILRLDFGDDEVQKNKMEEMFGRQSDKSDNQESVMENNQKQYDVKKYLMSSDYPLPLIKCLNDKYLYIHLLHKNKRSNFIYNRMSNQGFLQTPDSSFKLFCIGLYDNALISFLNPYELEKYIDKKCLTQESLEKMNEIKEDDNPILVKYYLK